VAEVNTASALFQIIASDLVLSGDNAVVIGLAVQHLRQPLRRRAVLFGTVGAIVLRVLFTIFATVLLKVPLLSALGGLTLFWIGYKLLSDVQEQHNEAGEVREGFFNAIRTIVIADAVMSLDNALAVAGAAKGDLLLLLIGLALSIPLLMIGSNFVSSLFNRLPWLTLVGAALIAWVGADLIHGDHLLVQWLPFLESSLMLWILRVVAVVGVLLLGLQAQRTNRLREMAEDNLRKIDSKGSLE
jgi:YjbE family integral membrane protein